MLNINSFYDFIIFIRPLAPHSSCILGFGLEPSVISTLTQTQPNNNEDRLVKLSKESIIRLLSHTAQR